MSLIRSIYRTVLSEELRWKIYNRKNIKREKKLRKDVIDFLESPKNKFEKSDTHEIVNYLKNNNLHVFPYEFVKKYKPENIEVFHDNIFGLNYVLHSGKKLYFKKNWSKEHIKEKYSFLLNEQDPLSAHYYLDKDFTVDDHSIVIDAGVAEGIFVLPIIDKIKHAYLFETDEEWIEALNATFSEYKDKVTIINKFVADKDDEMNVKLDTYFKDAKVDFIKIDVDGAEQLLLDGARELLSRETPLKIAICTYHNQQDEDAFDKMLRKYNFNCKTSDHYMLFFYDDNLKEPYLRRGVIRAQK
jgi:hypothetical protein